MIPLNEVCSIKKRVRNASEVDCEHAYECFNGGFYGKGCYEDHENNAMGGKPWQECLCMEPHERPE